MLLADGCGDAGWWHSSSSDGSRLKLVRRYVKIVEYLRSDLNVQLVFIGIFSIIRFWSQIEKLKNAYILN